MVRDDDSPITLSGAKAIARAADVSPSTVKRWHKEGHPLLFKQRDGTSPIRVRRDDLNRLRNGRAADTGQEP